MQANSRNFLLKSAPCDLSEENPGEISLQRSKKYFSAHYFHSISTNAYVYNLVTLLSGGHIDAAFAFHFHALLDQRLLFGPDHAVLHCPCGTWTRRRAGCGIVSAVEDHARLQLRCRIHSFTRDEIKKFRVSPRQVLVHH